MTGRSAKTHDRRAWCITRSQCLMLPASCFLRKKKTKGCFKIFFDCKLRAVTNRTNQKETFIFLQEMPQHSHSTQAL